MINTGRGILGGLLLATLLFNGCGDSPSDESMVSVKKEAVAKVEPKVQKSVEAVEPKIELKEVDLSDVFKDSAKIEPDGKYMVIIFDSKSCKYCNQLRQDIDGNSDLKNRLTNDYSSYSLEATENKLHKLMHEGQFMDVDTKTLTDIYSVTTTPTIIFTDKKAKSILVVPGYMPASQFLVTLDFIEKGLWLDKDRKDGSVYQALKDFYIKEGVLKEEKK